MKTLEINWEEIPQGYNYVAMDACGDVFAYTHKPDTRILDIEMGFVDCNFWVEEDLDSDPAIEVIDCIEDPENYNWKILYERPSITDRDS